MPPGPAKTARFCPRCRATFTHECAVCPDDGAALVRDRRDDTLAGRYRIERLIGIGGMGSTIWQATQLPLDRAVAIKFRPQLHTIATRRFDRGARLMARLSHPHITAVHDFGTLDDEHFLVMEWLRGGTLARVVERGPLRPRRALLNTAQLLRAAGHLHRQGVVHRNLKPSNIFMTTVDGDEPSLKLLGFGIAKEIRGDDLEAKTPFNPRVTQRGRICGTPEYMAPEQVLGEPVDGRADLYAVGVCLFRMLTGALPFGGGSRREIYFAKTRASAEPLSHASKTGPFSASLEALVGRALQRDPDARFQSADEFRGAVTAALR